MEGKIDVLGSVMALLSVDSYLFKDSVMEVEICYRCIFLCLGYVSWMRT